MDRVYMDRTDFYRFECAGCGNNCCSTHFYHYTIAESLYLIQGLSTIDQSEQDVVVERAKRMSALKEKQNYLCPLNVDGRCVLYPFRTMICRLHGLPYEFRRPDGQKDEGPGCTKFEDERQLKGLPYLRIDRGPFYRDLANLEKQIRQSIRYREKLKKTIAEMIVDGEVFQIIKMVGKST